DYVPLRNRMNDYLIDREKQKHHSFTGVDGIAEQDALAQDSQGVIADRTREHLTATDAAVVRWRRLMLDAARALAAGRAPDAPLVVAKQLQPTLAYDAERDFQPISMYGRLPNIIVVSAKLAIKTLPELVEHLKRNPGVGYGSVGNGSSQHLAGALFEQIAGVKMTHVPYRVTSQLQSDLVAGEVAVSFQLLPNVISAVKGGQVRAIAVANATRLPALPEVPTSGELGLK